MSEVQSTPASDRTLRAQAAAWLSKLHGPERTPQLEADFNSWLQADVEHRRAFEHITDIWDSINPSVAAGLPRVAIAQRRAGAAGVVMRVSRVSAIIASAAIASLGLAWFFTRADLYTTGIGEQRMITLADGTRLALNSDTRVEVNITATRRDISLEHGEAYFEVAHDPARPFTVVAGTRTVTAVGTTFDVRHDARVTEVTLIEGRVTVSPAVVESDVEAAPLTTSPPTASAGAVRGGPVTLTPGQRLTVAPGGAGHVDTPKRTITGAWRRGEVVLDETPLGTAAAEMNRYQREQLILDDARIARLLISGIYKTGDTAGFARAVANVYSLEIRTSGGNVHLSSRAEPETRSPSN